MSARYFDAEARSLVTLGQTDRLAANPFIGDWLEGTGSWHGMDWDSTAMRAVAGLIDDPYNSRQLPLVVDFTKGHAVLFGASGWGKTTFLRSLIVSLAATHSPDEFQAHVLDLGGRTWTRSRRCRTSARSSRPTSAATRSACSSCGAS